MTTAGLPEAITIRYEVAEQIGAGGHGSAYRAVDRASGQSVALKVLHRRFDDQSSQRVFEREVEALERLRDVPGVVSIQGHGIADQRGWIATELFPVNLADRARSFDRLDVDEVTRLGVALANTLADVHDAGVLHRDLKPSNVFLRADGSPVLGDFGVARIVDQQTLTASRGASLGFVAPEVIELGKTSPASDLYGLGATLYALLEGRPPYAESTEVEEVPIGLLIRRITEGNPVEFDAAVPAELASVVRELLSHDPGDRPDGARAVAARLQAAPPSGRRRQTATSDTSGRGRPRRSLFVGLGLLGAVGLLIAFALTRPDPAPVPPEVEVAAALDAEKNPASAPAPTEPPGETATFANRATGCPSELDDSDVLICDTFDAIDAWEVFEEPATATISMADGRVQFIPAVDAQPGSSYLERRIGSLPAPSDLFVRVHLRMTGGPHSDATASTPGASGFRFGQEEEWWQNLFGLADESSNTWGAGVQWSAEGYLVDLSFADPPDEFGGVLGAPVALADTTCLEMALGRADGQQPTLRVENADYTQVPDLEARNYGDGYVVRVGPIWLDPRPGAPTLEIDELMVATAPIGC